MEKPRVLICVLTGAERHQWVNPRLSMTLVNMTHDPRFQVQLDWVDAKPVAHARNLCMSKARSLKSDWVVMVDNDIAPVDPLTVLAQAQEHSLDIVGLTAGVSIDGKLRFATALNDQREGNFLGVDLIGAGCLMVRSSVWSKIRKGPWFKWESGDDELLSAEGGHGEDVHFCNLARAAGFRLWTHTQLAGHLHTVDLTTLIHQ